MGILGGEPFFFSIRFPHLQQSGRPEAAPAVPRADFKQQCRLLDQRAVRLQNRGLSIPYVGRLATGAIDFDNFKSIALLKLTKVGKPHIEATEVKFRYVIGDAIEGLSHGFGDITVPVAEYGAAAVTAGKGQANILACRYDIIEVLFVAFEVNMFDQTCASVVFDQIPQGDGFKIVEINGAGGEATHIWDRKTPILKAYRTLIKQTALLFEIGARNRRRGFRPSTLFEMWKAYRKEKRLTPQYPHTE